MIEFLIVYFISALILVITARIALRDKAWKTKQRLEGRGGRMLFVCLCPVVNTIALIIMICYVCWTYLTYWILDI